MAKFNDLIKENPQKAAGIIQDAFLHIVNTMIPELYVTKKEWHTLSKIIFSGQAKCPHEETEDGGTEDTSRTVNDSGENGIADPVTESEPDKEADDIV